jgi:excisionase family DNA binding protein
VRHSKTSPSSSPNSIRFYTVNQVAEMLTMSARSIWRRIKDRELPVHKFGRAVRISHPDLMAFLATRRDG